MLFSFIRSTVHYMDKYCYSFSFCFHFKYQWITSWIRYIITLDFDMKIYFLFHLLLVFLKITQLYTYINDVKCAVGVHGTRLGILRVFVFSPPPSSEYTCVHSLNLNEWRRRICSTKTISMYDRVSPPFVSLLSVCMDMPRWSSVDVYDAWWGADFIEQNEHSRWALEKIRRQLWERERPGDSLNEWSTCRV